MRPAEQEPPNRQEVGNSSRPSGVVEESEQLCATYTTPAPPRVARRSGEDGVADDDAAAAPTSIWGRLMMRGSGGRGNAKRTAWV